MRKPFDGDFPITQRFGEKVTDPAGHTGIDYALYHGTPVLAAMSGKVSRTACLGSGYGNHVILDHEGGLQTVYAHLSRVSVSFGDIISEGQIIGYSGNTGNSTGPHLHFEVRRLEKPVDPEPLLNPAAVLKKGEQRPIVDSLRKGSVISGEATAETVWLKIGKNRWTAVRYQGEDFCETAS